MHIIVRERLSALGLAHPIELNREIGMGQSNPFTIVALYSRGWVKFDSRSAELDEELLDLYGISLPENRQSGSNLHVRGFSEK